MKIIISPAKQMRMDDEACSCRQPVFLQQTERLLHVMRQMNYAQLKELWQCNDKLAQQNYERICKMNLQQGVTPAVLAYDGLQYTHMGPRVFDLRAWQYVCDNLRILSGFYGMLRADDGVVPYRLEMQAKLACDSFGDLYSFWGESLYRELTREDRVILNLASREYSKAVEPYLEKDIEFISCIFAVGNTVKYKVKATEAKMARGYMVRWCAEENITAVNEVKKFSGYGYKFCQELSNEEKYVFLKAEQQRI